MALPSARRVLEGTAFAAVIAARVYRTMLLTLAVVAVAPLVLSWQPYVVHSGSMEPAISVGDIAHGRSFADDESVDVGRVYMYRVPSGAESPKKERMIVHRIVERRDDGDYTTAGDANDVTDVDPLAVEDIEARAVLLVPYVGLPVVWVANGEWTKVLLWLLLTVLAFYVASRHVEGEPPRWTLLRMARDTRRRRNAAREPERTAAKSPGTSSRAVAALGTVAILCAAGGMASTTSAAFTARTQTVGSTWTAGFWQLPYIDAVMSSRPSGFWLLDEVSAGPVVDRSGTHPGGRTIGVVQRGVPGALPRNPGTAYRFGGGRSILHDQRVAAPSSHSIELWFRTTARTPGYLAGFESETGSTSEQSDRTILIDGRGSILVGEWVGQPYRVTATPDGFNDGEWHHLVVTGDTNRPQQGTIIYVDGKAVASGEATRPRDGNNTGFWRIGAGTTRNNLFPREVAFAGDLDATAIYHRVLTPAEVSAHWAAR